MGGIKCTVTWKDREEKRSWPVPVNHFSVHLRKQSETMKGDSRKSNRLHRKHCSDLQCKKTLSALS